ncbi:MAG: hypothetical protein ACXWWO_04765 [Candidatus Limnocylindria bacterium]
MTANQRRPGFRLPWSSEEENAAAPATGAIPEAMVPADAPSTGSSPEPVQAIGAAAGTSAEPAATPAATEPEPTAAADAEPPDEFLRELVAAMRHVADETKQTGLADAHARAEERVKQLEAEGERRRQDLSARAETDIASVGEWARSEAERIKAEAERRVSARRTQLDEQLAADQARGEADAKAVRQRIDDYERELEAFHAQLAEIADPAAFAAAAKRMPRPPVLEGATTPERASAPAPRLAPAPGPAPTAVAAVADATPAASTNGQQPSTPDVHPAEEQVLAARLAELDATLPAEPVAEPAAAPAPTAVQDTTEVVVSGLGSFGAITSFRQALSDVDGVQGVALSLGGSGEFVFRANHRAGFDIGAAITSLEGDAATVQPRPEGGLLVKLERRR